MAILFSGAERLGNFGRGSPKEHSCKIISKSIHRFRRRCLLSKLLTDAQWTMHDRQWTSNGHKSSPCALGSGELKILMSSAAISLSTKRILFESIVDQDDLMK